VAPSKSSIVSIKSDIKAMAPVSSLAAAAARMTLATQSTSSCKNTTIGTTSSTTSTSASNTTTTSIRAVASGSATDHTPAASNSSRTCTPPRKELPKKSSLAQYAPPIKSNDGTKHHVDSNKDQQNGGNGGNGRKTGKGKEGSSSARNADKPHQHSAKKNDSREPIAQFEFSLDDDADSNGNDVIPAVNRSRRNGHSRNEAGNKKQQQQQNQNQNPLHSSKNNEKRHPNGNASNGKVINVNVSKRLIGSALGTRRTPANNTTDHSSQNNTGRRNAHERIDRNDKRGAHAHPQGNRIRNSSDRIGTGREDTGRHESRSWDNTKNNSSTSTQGMHHGRNGNSRATWGNGDNNSNANTNANAKNKHQNRNNRYESSNSSKDTARLASTSNPKVEEQAQATNHKPRLVSRSEAKGPIEQTRMTNWADDSDSDSD